MGTYIVVVVGSKKLGLLNASFAIILIASSEGLLYSFIYKLLKTKVEKTFIPELLEIETAKRKLQSFYDLANIERSELNP